MFEILAEIIDKLRDICPSFRPYLSKFWLAIAFVLISIIGVVINFFKNLYKRYISIKYKKDLHPYFAVKQVIEATKYFIPTKYQNISPSLDEEPGRSHINSAKEQLLPLFLNKLFKFNGDDTKYYLILADSGMGKTTFMINLFLDYKRKWIVGKKFNIKLFPLGSSYIWDDIDKISDEDKANTILLLDAFDEDNEAIIDYKKRMAFVLSKVWRFREIVITCRTQFFPNEIDETAGYYTDFADGSGQVYNFQKLYISVFSKKDIRQYLLKKYKLYNPINWTKWLKAYNIAIKSPNLIVRPMLLSYIDDFIGHKQPFDDLEDIYSTLVDKWIERESRKAGIIEKYGSYENYKKLLHRFSMNFALDLYVNKKKRGGFFLPSSEAFHPKNSLDINDSNLKFIESIDQKTRSLLNRNAIGDYKFSHKSILEYFLFLNIVVNSNQIKNIEFDGLDILKVFLIKHLAKNFFIFFKINDSRTSIYLQISKDQNYKFNDYSNETSPLKSLNKYDIINKGLLNTINTVLIQYRKSILVEHNNEKEYIISMQEGLIYNIKFFPILPNLSTIIYQCIFDRNYFDLSPDNQYQFHSTDTINTSKLESMLLIGKKHLPSNRAKIIAYNEVIILKNLLSIKNKYTVIIIKGKSKYTDDIH